MADEQQTDPLRKVTEALLGLEIDYAVTGSMAGLFYGHNRATVDMDIVIELPMGKVPAFVAAFKDEYYIDRGAVEDAVRRGSMFNVIPNFGGPKVDLIVLRDDEHERLKFTRRVQLPWQGGLVSVVTAEDLVISKLQWAKLSHSDRQLGDVRAIMATGEASDEKYLEEWIDRLNLRDLLDEASSSRYDA